MTEEAARNGSVPARSAYRAIDGWVPLVLSASAIALLAGYLFTGPHSPVRVNDHDDARR